MRVRVGIWAGIAAGKLYTAMLLGVVSIALIIPGGDVALGQAGTGSVAQVALFTAIDLHPSGYYSSIAEGISGGQQVGEAEVDETASPHALLWRGSAASAVDLHPSGFVESRALGVCGGHQVGSGVPPGGPPGGRGTHALLWLGSAASVVDLHPNEFGVSEAMGTFGTQQVGNGTPSPMRGPERALLWSGSAASVVDLHPLGFTASEALGTSGDEQVGRGSLGSDGYGLPYHALLWRGSAASVVDLHPSQFPSSEALGVFGGQQVGSGSLSPHGRWPSGRSATISVKISHALLWRGSAASVVDLNPPGFIATSAEATNGDEQVGFGFGAATGDRNHALLWRGSATSVVDLHVFLPSGFEQSSAWAIDAGGNVVGSALAPEHYGSHAFLWKRNVPKPGTSRGHNAMGC